MIKKIHVDPKDPPQKKLDFFFFLQKVALGPVIMLQILNRLSQNTFI